MEATTTPTRLGIRGALAARLAAAGWIEGDVVALDAVPHLHAVRSGPDPEAGLERLADVLAAAPDLAAAALAEPDLGQALVAITGSSRALTRTVRRHPEWLQEAVGDGPVPAPPEPDAGAIRSFVRRGLLRVAVRDLLGRTDMPQVGRELADLADAAAAAALDLASAEAGARPELADMARVPFVVVAMGKWGGRELNYASDIDLVFVYDVPDAAPSDAHDYAQRVATVFMEALGGVTPEGVAFRVDADLRPEGKAGPLARSLDAYASYYERWAEPWEFQALIKARPAAGDTALAERFGELITPYVYPDTLPPDTIRHVRTLKARAEQQTSSRGRAHTEIKRGIGGIRDVEFSAQLLQLVHGRSDPELRGRDTLAALEALDRGGYVRPGDAAALHEAYRWLRDLEHRIQLWELRQTHELPEGDAGRERLARAMGYRDTTGQTARQQFEADLVRHRGTVRTIHEQLFYRPLLEAFGASPAVRLTPEGAARQLAALGFRDAAGARRAFDDLTAGLSRRSRLMEQLLPLMLDWLSEAPDPDLGLAQLRMLVTTTADNAGLVAALRDNPVAAERLCRVLGTSRLLGRLLDRIPEALAGIGDDDALDHVPRAADLADQARHAVALRADPDAARAELRRFVRRGLLRVALRDLLGRATVQQVGRELADVADAAAAAALDIAGGEVRRRPDLADLADVPFLVVAMGKWGGRELNYASDIDLQFVYDVPAGADPAQVTDLALRTATAFMEALGGVTPEGVAFRVDADLRPEGKRGPLARSLDAYASYYDRWAEPWEFQALIKARPAAGDAGLAERFGALVAPHVFPDSLPDATVRHVRHMKARIEKERIPPEEDASFHMKLGPGGLADVEFTAQLLQLAHGGRQPRVRVPGTLAALAALDADHLISPANARTLADAYRFCARVRNRLFLQAGKPRDSLPADPDDTARLALSLGYDRHPSSELREEYRRRTRRARRVVERLFYGLER